LFDLTVGPGKTEGWFSYCSTDNGVSEATITTVATVSDGGAGHQHNNGSRPSGLINPATVTVPCDGQSHQTFSFTYPEVAGVLSVTCTSDIAAQCQVWGTTLDVLVGGLVPLPASPYIVQVGMSAVQEALKSSTKCPHDHPSNHWGQPQLITDTLELAAQYYAATNQKLYVNDMSLPWGGILDFCDNWAPPHQTHRDGRHVDIRKNSMNSAQQGTFRKLAEGVFGVNHVCVDAPGTSAEHWHLSVGTPCVGSALEEFGLKPSDLK
jgi:hypothetical protein